MLFHTSDKEKIRKSCLEFKSTVLFLHKISNKSDIKIQIK